MVNPATDTDTVTLTWSLPAELPAYAVVALAEAAQTAAEAAASSAVDIATGSPRGDLVATSPTLPTASVANNTAMGFGASEVWSVEGDAPDGFAAGETANNERLYLPDIHPAGSNGVWIVSEVSGVEVYETFIEHGGKRIGGCTTPENRRSSHGIN